VDDINGVIGEVDFARAQAAALFPERIYRKTELELHASGEITAATPRDFLEAGVSRGTAVLLDSPGGDRRRNCSSWLRNWTSPAAPRMLE